MPIPQQIREACIEIMDNVMKRPCAALFLEPVDPDRDGAPNYFAVVKKPVDLGTIRKRLINDEYQSVAAWNREMNLVWGNAEKFNGRDSYLCTIALEIRRNFEKEFRKIKTLSLQKWAQTVSELKDCLDNLLDTPPEPVTKFATISEKPDPNQLKPFTEDEMDIFIRSSMLLTSKQDAKKMLHIIRFYEPRFSGPDPEKLIDVGQLSVSTLHALRDYINQRINDLNLPFPK
ncbi:Bromodomain containing protein [Tritrichomonas foetus]|uniref:Bromodomain containing protein n=1 Tax=Tritrichomonas foetus TaxID=1144522 RepID=A0A1J4K607_9EUKA|nr:Bromodomain containing protein [Tritrichomonas foetus]|eukprot:OHT06426.1 Bromodomain containing protein [Tritrichomonas foetus]